MAAVADHCVRRRIPDSVRIICQIIELVVSIRNREALRDRTGDPWDGRTLEWITTSPPPAFNFAVLPNVTGEEAYWGIKQIAIENKRLTDLPDYKPIEMPKNTPTGFVVAFFATITGFCADLAHLVAGGGRPGRRLCDLRRLRLAGSCGIRASCRRARAGRRRTAPRAHRSRRGTRSRDNPGQIHRAAVA